MDGQKLGLIDNWLMHIEDVMTRHQDELDLIDDVLQKSNLLVELNVKNSVRNGFMIDFKFVILLF